MARLLELNRTPDRATLRRFGWVACGAFGVLALLAFEALGPFGSSPARLRVPLALALGGFGVLSGMLSFLRPEANRASYLGLSILFFPLGFVVSYAALAALFFLVIGPIALLVRAFAGDPLRRRYDRSAQSYWVEAEARCPKSRYLRQF
jgi:hypothetical protein